MSFRKLYLNLWFSQEVLQKTQNQSRSLRNAVKCSRIRDIVMAYILCYKLKQQKKSHQRLLALGSSQK